MKRKKMKKERERDRNKNKRKPNRIIKCKQNKNESVANID